ncbi:MAG: secretin N-terminal domain-containing protein [Candidatus Methylomirabilales bacterium]
MKRKRSALLVPIVGSLLFLSACADSTPPISDGQELMRTGSYDQAVKFYMERLGESPRSIEARIGLVQALRAAAGLHADRGAKLEEAGRLDPALVEYHRSLKYNAEESRARQGVERVTGKQRALELLVRGRKLLGKGTVQEAAQLLEEARSLDPKNSEIQQAHREATDRLKQAAEAESRAGELAAAEQALSLLSTKPVTLRFKETDIKEVLDIISKLAQVNILVDEGVRAKKVTSYVKDLPLRQAFSLILSTNRLFAKQVNANSLIVIPDTPAKHRQYDELQVRTFYLSNADAKVTVNLLRTILSTRQIFVDEKLNAVTVRDTPAKIALADKLINLNDRGGGEVEIELEILEVDRTKLRDLGIFFTDQYQAAFGFPGAPGATIPGTTTPQALSQASFFEDLVLTNPSLLLNLIKTDSEAKILANPTLRVLDRQKASILIGEQRPFQVSELTSTTATTAQPGTAPSGTIQETRVEFRDVALKLTFTPIIRLEGDVTIELNFEFSTLGEAVGGNELTPSVNRRNLNTFITIKNGESRLLGGLIQDETRKTVQRSPILGDLPIIGRLFRNEREDKVRRDIIISITPRVVKSLEPPHPEAATFWAGTSESLGARGAVRSVPTPRRRVPRAPRRAVPRPPTPTPPGQTAPR